LILPEGARAPLGGVPLWAVAATAVPAGALAALLVPGRAEAAHGARTTPAPRATVAVSPAVAVSGGPSVRLRGGPSVRLPGDDGGGGDGVARPGPPGPIRHHLEFTGAFGWPDMALGCFFDPDARGADRHGRRIVCVETVVRPPVFGPTRIRGLEHRHRHRR
jgi:hypothetical protein